MTKQEILSEIIRLEYEVTMANLLRHRPTDDDEYSEKRKKINELRKNLKNYGN
jgi:methyl coenzyme M reductase subunit D